MKLITFRNINGAIRIGFLTEKNRVVDLYEASDRYLPKDMLTLIENQEEYLSYLKQHHQLLGQREDFSYSIEEIELKAPLPNPKSVRDFYAFEEHVKTARGNRGLEMIPQWYEFPVFYFTNHLAIKGPHEKIRKPKQCQWLDYELEIACVIGKEGRNIPADLAEDYIFGYMIMNDWSARDLQREEMKVGLGPAKGKDFATSFGPWLVTKDELESLRTSKGYDVEMTAKVNGMPLSKGNMKDLYFSFHEMIERASAGTTLYPGEILGSGTVGTGCILELGTDIHRYLEPGDEVELEITNLGILKNAIIQD